MEGGGGREEEEEEEEVEEGRGTYLPDIGCF